MAIFKPEARIVIKAAATAHVVLLGGEPLAEPRHVWWNFVSSSKERIEQAKDDWKSGRFARIPGDDQEFIPLPD
jgi:redox-sensitive bicupin YhaK (pirin superfamily)